MRTTGGCDPDAQPNAWRHGDEPHWLNPEFWDPSDAIPDTCGDCGAHIGGHHHESCLHARCRACDDQAVMCYLDDAEHRDMAP